MEHIMHEREYIMNNMEIFVLCPEKKTSTLTGKKKTTYLHMTKMLMVLTWPSSPNFNTTIGKLAQCSLVCATV